MFEGSIYDESVDQGSLNFSIRNTQDQPIEFSDNITLQPASIDFNEFYHNTLAFRINFGSEEGYLFLTNINSAQTFLSGDSLFVTFSRLDLENPHYRQFENKDVQFLLLGKEEYSSLNNEIAGLDEDKLFSFDWDPVEQKQNITVDYILAQSELAEILSKYNPHIIESIEFPSQIIQVENLKLTIGRTNMVMEYNENERTIENFAMIREDGSRINFRLYEQYVDSSGNATKTRLNWIVDGVNENRFFAGAGNLNGDLKLSCNYGFILGNDEKVKIEANGITYE